MDDEAADYCAEIEGGYLGFALKNTITNISTKVE